MSIGFELFFEINERLEELLYDICISWVNYMSMNKICNYLRPLKVRALGKELQIYSLYENPCKQ